MPTEHQQRLAGFYDNVVRLAYSGACNHWCRTAPDLPVDDGVTLVPREYGNPAFFEAWPTLPIGPGDALEPAFVLDRYVVEQTFTRILKYGSDIDAGVFRRELHVAEQEGDIRKIGTVQVNFVVQIAVFGKVVFGL